MNMLNYKKLNNIIGWLVFAIAATTYILTMEGAGSFWDCGEFASCAFKLQNPHPPGAPLFIIMGRFFVILFGSIIGNILAINLLSALSSAFTILFLFWTITFLAKRLVQVASDKIDIWDLVKIFSAGAVGALAFTFSDTFWFNAVESEVYAMSSFFSALSFWMLAKWSNATDEDDAYADKWLILMAFTIGIAIGVHLLNILTIPAAVLFYYFKKYPTTKRGSYIAFFVGCALTGFIQKFAIQGIPSIAAGFDLFFVNTLGMPFYSGVIFFILLLIVALYFVLKWTINKGYYIVKLLTWSFIFIIVGFSTYSMTIIRSNANPPIDMYNVDNMQTLLGYLSREQYGDFPLVYGQVYTAKSTNRVETGKKYDKANDKYVVVGNSYKEEFNATDKMFFPRVWDHNNQQNHVAHYEMWLGLQPGEKPSFADNLKFFFAYQMNWMYFRYFMWNFAGRQNDIQNVLGGVRDGNWLSGISIIDNMRLGDQDKVPSYMHNLPSRNKLFMLPFLLGILGAIYQYKKTKKDFITVGLLFFFTGIAIAIYLNMAGNQPRERDYAFVGSFYAYSIWIGLGVLMVIDFLCKLLPKIAKPVVISSAIAICVIGVPVLMANQEWDDHDRGGKTLVRDVAINYLESCPPNAILFCYGDNDTYPLWYAQQVEGIRTDVRVINTALLGAEWYVNQMRYKLDKSDRIKLPFSKEKTMGSNNDVVFFNINKQANTRFYDLDTILNLSLEQRKFDVSTQSGAKMASLPVSKFIVKANEDNVRKKIPSIYPSDIIDAAPQISIPQSYLDKYLFRNNIAILATIGALKWERPVCFTSPSFVRDFNLQRYARSNGLVYELAPISNNTGTNINWILELIDKNKYAATSTQKKDIYYNEEDRRNINMLRKNYLDLTSTLIQVQRKEEAKRIFKKCLKDFSVNALPFAERHDRFGESYYIALQTIQLAKELGEEKVFNDISVKLLKNLKDERTYYQSLSPNESGQYSRDSEITNSFIQELEKLMADNKPTTAPLPPVN